MLRALIHRVSQHILMELIDSSKLGMEICHLRGSVDQLVGSSPVDPKGRVHVINDMMFPIPRDDLKDAVLKIVVVDRPIIKQTVIGVCRSQVFDQAEGENAEGQATDTDPWRIALDLPNRSFDDQASSLGQLAGDDEHAFDDAQQH